jgi:rhamnosyltransferase
MKIAVILAAYNGEKYIKEQIDSILSQNEVSLDIMVFDDSSKDNTVKIVESFGEDKRVNLIQNVTGTGSAANNFFNAIQVLPQKTFENYDYIALSDQDDIWLPNKLKAAVYKLQKEKTALYCSNLMLWDEATKTESLVKKSHPQKKYDYLFEGGSAGCTYVFTSNFCIALKKTIVETDYKNWKFFSHDWFIYFFARANNYTVTIDQNAYIKYRMHADNLHGHLNKKTIWASIERLKVLQNGWYVEHIKGFRKLLPYDSIEQTIYRLYLKNYFSRLYVVLRYNFKLNRSFKKNIQFFIISALPLFKKQS